MQIRVADIPPEGLLLKEDLDPLQLKDLKALQEKEVCHFKGLLAVELQVTPLAQMLVVKGRIQTTLSLTCGRCLAAAHSPVQGVFELTFKRAQPGDDPDPLTEPQELQSEEMGLVFFDGDAIDFRDVIQEQVILAIPMQPLCRGDCRGLCPRCGADLNRGPCDCHANDIDPRLAILKSIKFDE